MHEGVQRALSSPLSTSYNGSASPPVRANSAGAHVCQVFSTSQSCLPLHINLFSLSWRTN